MQHHHRKPCLLYNIEKLHQTTTNHTLNVYNQQLYNIEKLHQTTTIARPIGITLLLYNIEKLHQTTTTHGIAYRVV